jgi:hypothetical protein
LTQGDITGTATLGSADHVRFILDQVEIDLAKEFGENIRLRADIDFRDLVQTPDRALRAGTGAALDLEQGYVTANIAVGNGMEFLLGKFNCPIGLESVDRNSNVFTTYTPAYMFIMPTNAIGFKFYYAFNDNWSMDLGGVNNMNGLIAGNSALPSGLLRVGVTWGDEGNESYVHAGGMVGPEASATIAGQGTHNAHLDYFGDLWGNFAFGDSWDWTFEGTYRQSNSVTAGQNTKAIAGQTYINYAASDVWDIHLRYAYFWEVNPGTVGSGASLTGGTWSGFEGTQHSGTLGASYMISDGAKVKFEYRFDMAMRGSGLANPNYHTGAVEMAYSF